MTQGGGQKSMIQLNIARKIQCMLRSSGCGGASEVDVMEEDEHAQAAAAEVVVPVAACVCGGRHLGGQREERVAVEPAGAAEVACHVACGRGGSKLISRM